MNLMKENDIQYALADQNIAHIREISIKTLHNRYYTTKDETLHGKRFDYYLPNLRSVIEFDGDQHFTPIDYFGGMKQFMKTVTTDFLKMNYCFDNNIKVIRLTANTDSDLLVDALNDNRYNLITIKNNQVDKQNIDQFDLPESFNVYIENQALKLKIDELERKYNQKEVNKLPDMDKFMNYVRELYPNLFNKKYLPKQLLKAIYDDYKQISPYSKKRRNEQSFYHEISSYIEHEGYDVSDSDVFRFSVYSLFEILTDKHVKSTDNLNLYDYVPEHSNVLRLLQSIDKIKQFRCYTKNK